MASSAPRAKPNTGVIEAATAAFGPDLLAAHEYLGEVTLLVARDALVRVMTRLRDEFAYQQLMEIAGVDYPDRAERFEVVYHLLSVTRNLRLRVKVMTDEASTVPSVTGVWPNANWLEREVFDMYGVRFAGHPDLRRILTDYGFRGHPQRKDFPLSGFVELRYSEVDKRVVYEPVRLAQDFRNFDFLSPWEGMVPDMPGADQTGLPGDEKAVQAKPAEAPAPAAARAPARKDA